MPTQQGPPSKKKTAAKSKKLTPEQFAINQLKKAGITPKKGGDVKEQFRVANLKAVKSRKAAGLGRARTVGASSALAAGKLTANPKVQKKRATAAKLKRQG